MVPKHLAAVQNGNLKMFYPERYQQWLNNLNGFVEVVVKPRRHDRSDKQNNYLWGVVYKLISEHTGYSDEEVHLIFKTMFLKKRIGQFEVVGSTAKLNTKEFTEYINKIIDWAARELLVEIPLPDAVEYD
ncbi:MAG: hypothetical protein ACOZBH_04430 [Patescibacteria group bacterium]